jgi:hypothetical protein
VTAGWPTRFGDSPSNNSSEFALLFTCSKFTCSIAPGTRSRKKSQISQTRGTNSSTLSANLTRIIAAWPDLPPHFQAAIVTLCQVPGNAGKVPLGGAKLVCIHFLKLLKLSLLRIVFTLAAWAAGAYFGRFYFLGDYYVHILQSWFVHGGGAGRNGVDRFGGAGEY